MRAFTVWAGLLIGFAAIGASPAWSELDRKPDDWHRSPEGRRVADHVVGWQTAAGSWPKNVDTTSPVVSPARPSPGTFDNGATTSELRFLARAHAATGENHVQQAILRGLEHVLSAQYANGGWPQSYPPGTGYARHITFNDDTMVHLLELVREVATHAEWSWVGDASRVRARAALRRGVECIVRCQVRSGNQLTVWCAQHDEVDYRPRPARSYELVSLSGSESARILRFLMSLEDPGAEVVTAIEAGAAWFEAVKLSGIRVVEVAGNRVVREDPDAPPIWARFYEIGTDRPIFAGRDGVKRYRLDEIESERRNGYAWYGNWGEAVAREYAEWQTASRRSAADTGHD